MQKERNAWVLSDEPRETKGRVTSARLSISGEKEVLGSIKKGRKTPRAETTRTLVMAGKKICLRRKIEKKVGGE